MKENNFYLDLLTIKEEFNQEYKRLEPFGKSLSLSKSFEEDENFMLAFEEEFSRTSTKPDLDKYWIGLFTKKKLDEYILIQKGIIQNKKTTLTETILKVKEIEFNELSRKNKLPKECYIHQIEETNIYKQFRIIEDILNRFKEMKGFDNSADSLLQQAEEFGKGLVSEIHNINYEPIRNKIIEVIINDKENINTFIKGYINNNFNKKEFEDNYRKAKMYLDNYLITYLETQVTTIKENNQSNDIEKKPTKKEVYLFEIGLKLAQGELDEDLIIKEGRISLNTNLSFPKLANKHQLDEVYLKCTISNYTETNQTKNLRNNPEIIKKVIKHLESTDKEPKEWFLKEFKTIVL